MFASHVLQNYLCQNGRIFCGEILLNEKIMHLLQIADSLYYNAALTLSILQKLGVATEIFNLWFQMLQQVKKSGVRANFKRWTVNLVYHCYFAQTLSPLPKTTLLTKKKGKRETSWIPPQPTCLFKFDSYSFTHLEGLAYHVNFYATENMIRKFAAWDWHHS